MTACLREERPQAAPTALGSCVRLILRPIDDCYSSVEVLEGGARGGLDESKVSKVYRGRKEPLIISHSFDINSLNNHQLLHLNINTKLLFSQLSLPTTFTSTILKLYILLNQ